jgi:hypothetical protein
MDRILTKGYQASAAVNPFRFVTHAGDDRVVAQASGVTDKIIGSSDMVGQLTPGQDIDITHIGIGEITLGAGGCTRGDFLTSDANGKAVRAVFQPGSTIYTGGFALESGNAGDVIPYVIAPGFLANEAQSAIVDVTLTTAQIKALFTTPIQVLAAPGANKAYVIRKVTAYMPYNANAYTIGTSGDLKLRYTGAAGAELACLACTGFVDEASSQVRVLAPEAPALAAANLTPVANAAVFATMATANLTVGDSPIKLRIHYEVIDTVL